MIDNGKKLMRVVYRITLKYKFLALLSMMKNIFQYNTVCKKKEFLNKRDRRSDTTGNSALLICSKSDIGLLVDVGEGGVESLWLGIVEGTWASVVLSSDHNDRLNVAVTHETHTLVLGLSSAETGSIAHGLFTGLLCLLACLDREGVLAGEARPVTPVSAKCLSLSTLLFLALAR